MDIDKLIQKSPPFRPAMGFGSLMDIDKLIRGADWNEQAASFGSLMDIDKLIPWGNGGRSDHSFWFSDGY